jgi:hypothetical protein
MASGKRIDLFPFSTTTAAQGIGLSLKPSVILIRWPVVILCTYLLLYPAVNLVPSLDILQRGVVLHRFQRCFVYPARRAVSVLVILLSAGSRGYHRPYSIAGG